MSREEKMMIVGDQINAGRSISWPQNNLFYSRPQNILSVCVCIYILFYSQCVEYYSTHRRLRPQLRRVNMHPIFTTPPTHTAFNASKSNTVTTHTCKQNLDHNFTIQRPTFYGGVVGLVFWIKHTGMVQNA